ncbi:MAG: hypothetical protein GY838_05085 [bacterium]|nr:hypothetical protein [bacterium]
MRKALLTAFLVLFMGLLATSCADIDAEEDAATGPLVRDTTVTLTDAIPAEFGDLVAVTTTEIYPDFAQLWFQKEDKSIVTVFLNYKRGTIEKHPLVIPRS